MTSEITSLFICLLLECAVSKINDVLEYCGFRWVNYWWKIWFFEAIWPQIKLHLTSRQ